MQPSSAGTRGQGPRHAEGAVPVLNPSAAAAPGRYLLRAEGMGPVVQNEPDLRVRPAFRPQGRAHPRLVLPPSHFGVHGSGSLVRGPSCQEALCGVLWLPKAPCGGKDALRGRNGFWEM